MSAKFRSCSVGGLHRSPNVFHIQRFEEDIYGMCWRLDEAGERYRNKCDDYAARPVDSRDLWQHSLRQVAMSTMSKCQKFDYA